MRGIAVCHDVMQQNIVLHVSIQCAVTRQCHVYTLFLAGCLNVQVVQNFTGVARDGHGANYFLCPVCSVILQALHMFTYHYRRGKHCPQPFSSQCSDRINSGIEPHGLAAQTDDCVGQKLIWVSGCKASTTCDEDTQHARGERQHEPTHSWNRWNSLYAYDNAILICIPRARLI